MTFNDFDVSDWLTRLNRARYFKFNDNERVGERNNNDQEQTCLNKTIHYDLKYIESIDSLYFFRPYPIADHRAFGFG
jgi:hypothetical protein